MRAATEEEDNLLRKISRLESDIYNLENEVMLCESESRGLRELRRKYTVKFFTVIFVCSFLLIGSSGFLVHLGKNWRLTIALYLGSGGLGFFALGFLIYTIIYLVRYFAATSKTSFWSAVAEKIGVENIDNLENVNLSKLSSYKQNISDNRQSLDETTKAYFELKEKNDKIFEEEIASGKRKPDFNFDAYNNYVEVSNEQINFNKLKVKQVQLSNRKKLLEKEVEDMIINEDKSKQSIIWFLVLLALLVVTIVLLVISSFFETELAMIIHIAVIIFFMMAGIVLIINLINFITKLPYISDSKIALDVADKLGIDKTKKDLKDMMAEIDTLREDISETNEKIKEMKEAFAKERDESF